MGGLLLLGYGQLGRALASAARDRGARAVTVWTRRPVAAEERAFAVSFVHTLTDLAPAIAEADMVLLALPDAALAGMAERLAALSADWEGKIALHASGVHDAGVLAPLARRGAAVAVCHPLRAFGRSTAVGETDRRAGTHAAPRPDLTGTIFIVTGDPRAVQQATSLVKELGGVPLTPASLDSVEYHLAATIAANFGLILRDWARRRFAGAGLSGDEANRAADALLQNALENAADARGELPLTGPFRRGDASTIEAHLTVLEGSELLAYASLGLLLLERARAAGEVGLVRHDDASTERIEAGLLRAIERALAGVSAPAAGATGQSTPRGGPGPAAAADAE